MASITIGKNKINSSNPYCVLTVTDGSPNTANNTSVVSYKLVLKRPSNVSSSASKSWSVTIDGTKYNGSGSIGGSGDKTLLSGTKTISHNSDGSKSISFSATFNPDITWAGHHLGSMSGSGSMSFTKIARYFSSLSCWVASRTETSVTISWKTGEKCDGVWAVYDGSEHWINDPESTSGSFTINGLGANTTRNVYLRLKRQDSQLKSNTNTVSAQTYNWPYCSNAHAFNVGNSLTLSFYNPLKRNIHVSLYANNGTQAGDDWTTGTSLSPYTSPTCIDAFLKDVPNKRTGHFTVKVEYSGHVNTRNVSTDTYYVPDKYGPKISNTTAYDLNNSVIEATGSRNIVVQGLSHAQTVGTVSSQKWATLKSWTHGYDGVIRSGTFGSNVTSQVLTQDWNSAKADNFTITVTDSRGIKTTYIHKIKFTIYALPKLAMTAIRGVYDPIYKTWVDNETEGLWAKIVPKPTVDSRLKIDTNKSTITLNGVTTKYSDSSPLYLGENKLKTTIGYAVEAVLYDNLGQSIKATVALSSGKYIMYVLEESGVSFGGEAEDGYIKSYLPLKLTKDIYYQGKKSTYPIIKFMPNEIDTFGEGIAIGGGGAVVIGAGESSDLDYGDKNGNGGTEALFLASDGTIYFYDSAQNGIDSANKTYILNGSYSGKWQGYTPTGLPYISSSKEKTFATNDTLNKYYLNKDSGGEIKGALNVHDMNVYGEYPIDGYDSQNGQNMFRIMQRAGNSNRGSFNVAVRNSNGEWGYELGMLKENGGRTILRSNSNGGMYLGTDTYRWNTVFCNTLSQTSDLKVKEVVEGGLDNAKEFIMSLRPIAYRRTDTEEGNTGVRTHMGFGAQDVNKSLKDADMDNYSVVEAVIIKDEFGADQYEEPYHGEEIDDSRLSWGLAYSELIAPLVKLVQDQQKEIDELKSIIGKLNIN